MASESGLGYTLHPPKSYTPGRKSGQPTVIIIHTTEGSEGPTSAEDGAAYDARRTDGTSTHFFVDQNSVVQCVRTTDEAHAARTHGNDVGIQIEVCGRAGQGSSGWNDSASLATLENVAKLCVQLRAKYPGRFPLKHLTPDQLRAGGRGFAAHADCTYAWPEDNGTHTDPGPTFPWGKLLDRIDELELIMAAVDLTNDAVKEVAAAVIDAMATRDGVWRSPSWRADQSNAEWPMENVLNVGMEDTHKRLVDLATALDKVVLRLDAIEDALKPAG